MRAQFMLFPAALVAAAVAGTPAQAKVFLSIKTAQRLMFPGAQMTPHFFKLTDSEAAGITRSSGAMPYERQVKAWHASHGGWFIVDQVEGRDDIITYALALTEDGAVRNIEILECTADYDTITMPEWRDQFTGRRAGDAFDDVQTISGATLSSRHVTEGVKRILSTYALVLKSAGT